MASKIYKKGNYIFIEAENAQFEGNSSDVLFRKTLTTSTSYRVKGMADFPADVDIHFADITDGNGDPFSSQTAFEDWYTVNTGFNTATGGSVAIEDVAVNLSVIPASIAGTYISGATTIGTGTGQVNPTDWLKEELTSNGVTKVTITGRFDSWDEDSAVTITLPAGTMTTTVSAICTRETGNHTTPVNMDVTSALVYVINREDGVNSTHGVSFQIVGVK